MSMGFHQPQAAWLLGLAAVIVIFYFLRLRRPQSQVPSLALWRAVLEDRRVNAPFQRFRRHLSLLLQLLMLLLLALAAMQPYSAHGDIATGHTPILIDCSASMGALTSNGGPTRLEVAKRHVRERIDHLAPDEKLCLIAFSNQARQLTGFTDDRQELNDALSHLAVEQVPSSLDNALELAQGLWRNGGFSRLELVSDGNLPSQVDADLSFHIDYAPMDLPAPNAGITACDARRRSDGQWDVFCSVDFAALAPTGVRLQLLEGSQLLNEHALRAHPDSTERLVITIPGDQAVQLEARLVSDSFDALACDDRAVLVLPALRPLRTWIAPGMVGWRRALAGLSGLAIDAEGAPAAIAPATGDAAYDLCISNRPGAPSAQVMMWDGVVPDDLTALLTSRADGGSTVVDWRRSDPLLAHVGLDDLVIAQRIAFSPGRGEHDVEARGWQVLVTGDHGPLLVARQQSEHEQFALLFSSERSTLPYRVGFPVLAANLVEVARVLAGQSEAHVQPTGILPAQRAPPQHAVRLEDEGVVQQGIADSDGLVSGLRVPTPGLYVLTHDQSRREIGVGLLSRSETRLASVATIHFHELSLNAADEHLREERSWWPGLVLAALLVCLVEWWYAHCRPWRHS